MAGHRPPRAAPPGAAAVTAVATAVVLIGVPATIVGNEAAARLGRRRVVAAVMPASAAPLSLVV